MKRETFTATYKLDKAWEKRVKEYFALPWYKRIFKRFK